ncbi:ATP-binding protein [Metasolibacillus meyeri]|uniref:Signal transduction histidine-protein kinase ArlS n=1 Tax=Metasolibacillus meyeri TaxID=1071052 RepID=A0AAW9NH31_9BACL|nr:ATP-binding protein [Metasolibacillus meyeri]MEC1177017.1 ATP-binding protein [Metasolibacillus meyeri]
MKQLFNRMSLKEKWMLSTATTIFISYALICLILYISLHTWLLNNEERGALRSADDMSSFFETLSPTTTIQQLQDRLSNTIGKQEQTIRIMNFDGINILSFNEVSPSVPTVATYEELLNTVIRKTDDAYIVERIVQIGPFQGYMQLIHPLTTFHKMMQYVLTTMILVGIGALLLVALISYYLANHLIRPIQQLRDSMRSVRDKGLTAREAFTYHADDEIGDLLTMYDSMLEELNISFTQQQQFVADASHELRTPIQAVEGHLSLLTRWGKDDPQILNESIASSLTEVQRMKKMIEELLQLARREQVSASEADVAVVLTQAINELIAVYPDTLFQVEETEQKQLAAISPEALAQILRNIMENGIRYNETVPEIIISTAQIDGCFYVEIKDNGIGIAKEHLPFIFDRFYRVDESRQQKGGGTGLGLSITKMLATKYHVELKVQSEIRQGTTFLLKIPLKK